MGINGLIYSFVARGTGSGVVVLAEYTAFDGNFDKIALQCAQKLAANNHSITYTCDHHTFNYLVEDGITYLVVAEEDFGRQISFACLGRIKEDFRKKYGGEATADMAIAHSLDKKFGPVMKEHMRYCVEHPEDLDKMAKIKAQVQDVKGIMMQNIDKVLERHEKLEIIVDKAGTLAEDANTFQKHGKVLRRKMWFANMKMKLLVLLILLIVALVIWVSICGGFSCSNGSSSDPTPPAA